MAFLNPLRLAAAALALATFGGIADAGDGTAWSSETPLGVVELFTSQGCSSCPPADEFFAELAAKPGIVALAYHVDYWDYLGWKDTLSSKKNTERQYAYMRSFGSRSVYTPQAVINGRTHVNGADRASVDNTLADMKKAGEGMSVDLKVTRDGDGFVIETGDAGAHAAAPTNAHVVIVYFQTPQTISIGKGENGGRKETYWNAVSEIQTAGMWHGKAQRYELPMSELTNKGGCAVLLQAVSKDGLPGPILGAAIVRYE